MYCVVLSISTFSAPLAPRRKINRKIDFNLQSIALHEECFVCLHAGFFSYKRTICATCHCVFSLAPSPPDSNVPPRGHNVVFDLLFSTFDDSPRRISKPPLNRQGQIMSTPTKIFIAFMCRERGIQTICDNYSATN